MIKEKIILTIVCSTILLQIFCQTPVSGGIYNNTTWYASNSPYIVTGDVAIYPGNTLTVEAGTMIKFDQDKRLIVRGTLLLNGEPKETIILTSNKQNPAMSDWVGIVIENDQGGNVIGTNAHGEYAERFMEIMYYSDNQPINLKNSVINDCNFAFYGFDHPSNYTTILDNDSIINNNVGFVYGQNALISNCVFANGQKGVHGWDGPNITIKNSEFYNHSTYTVNIDGIIDSCHIHDNEIGIRLRQYLKVSNCTIENNNIGIHAVMNFPVSCEGIHDNIIRNSIKYNFLQEFRFPINIPNNCWGLNSEEQIGLTIYDGYDNVSLGLVNFSPYKTDCVPTEISNQHEITNFTFYPNPADDFIFNNSITGGIFEIYTLKGIMVKKGKYSNKINVTELIPGIYGIKTISDKEKLTTVSKIIIK